MEVSRGVRQKRLYQAIRQDFAVMCWVPTTHGIWERATDLAWQLAGLGFTMQLTDLVIAVSAMSVDAMVLTHDSDFRRIPGLRVIETLS
jgi:predicted nucleic acid-binding protein